jgi:hypothetical protein
MPTATELRLKFGIKAEFALIVLAATLGILSAVRWPQLYTVSQMLIDYHFGFGKRGLIGFILHGLIQRPYHYRSLAFLAFAVFALWLMLLAMLLWKSLIKVQGLYVPVALFFLSAGFSCLVCDIGRGEHFGLLLCLACLLLPTTLKFLPVRTGILLASVLMQEVNFLIFVPLVAFDAWIGVPKAKWTSLIWIILAMLPVVVLTWYLGELRTACGMGTLAYFQDTIADFKMQWRPLATLCNGGRENLQIVATFLWAIPANAVEAPLALIVALPSTILNIFLTMRVLRGRTLEIAFCIGVVFAPLAILVVAADAVRFVTLIQLTSLLTLVSATRRLGVPQGGLFPVEGWVLLIIFLITAFELGSSVPLNDGSPMLKFPFEPLIQRAIMIAQGTEHFMLIPSQ